MPNTSETIIRGWVILEEQKYDVLRDFYICYVTKTSFKEGAFLGYGIHVENPQNGALSSPCEYMTLEAFNSGTRRSSTNQAFEFWLPILVKTDLWKDKVKAYFLHRVRLIAEGIKYNSTPHSTILKVCSSLMNQLVVEVMNNQGNVTANDKFINGYFSLYLLMKQYGKDDANLVKLADDQLGLFIGSAQRRSKKDFPNLGELLIYLTVSQKYAWKDIAFAFQQECDARNFFWYAIGNQRTPPKYPDLKNPSAQGRPAKVFTATQVSRNLVMFQVRFSRLAQSLTLEAMDANFGLASPESRDQLKGAYVQITKAANWGDYFTWLEMPVPDDATRSKQLVDALNLSKSHGYHK